MDSSLELFARAAHAPRIKYLLHIKILFECPALPHSLTMMRVQT